MYKRQAWEGGPLVSGINCQPQSVYDDFLSTKLLLSLIHISMIPLPETSSPSTLRTRRVSACEPLCARLGDGVACVPAESCLPHMARDARIVAHSGGGDGQHRICLVCGEAAALPNALGGARPHTPFSGGSPAPTLPPQLSEGTREIISERSLIMKKDIKFSTRMASADREKIKALAAKAHMSMSDYVTACCLGKRIVVIDEQKTTPTAQRHRQQHQQIGRAHV